MTTSQEISQYLTLEEVTFSTTAVKNKIVNLPNETQRAALVAYGRFLFDPLRRLAGCPIIVTSGFRSKELNAFVDGEKKSQHLDGQALDIKCFGLASTKALAELVLSSGLSFDQMILEFNKSTEPHSGWVHLSYVHHTLGVNRKQVLSSYTLRHRNGRETTMYRDGLVHSDL